MLEDVLERISDRNRLLYSASKLRNRPDVIIALVLIVVFAFLVLGPLLQIINIHKDQLTISVKVNGFADIGMDDPVWIRFDSTKINFYNPETENLIA